MAHRGLLPMKAVAASAAAVALYFAGPSIEQFASTEVPKVYGAVVSWLTPPYLYFIVNVIIISIAASSRFHNPAAAPEDHAVRSAPPPKPEFVAAPAPVVEEEVVRLTYDPPAEHETSSGEEVEVEKKENDHVEEEDDQEFMISRSTWTTPAVTETEAAEQSEYTLSSEKPLVSARLGRRKSLKASPDGGKGALGVLARPKRNDTLESTWKAITDGRAVPLTRHLKKSDTWETTAHSQAAAPEEPRPVAARKCETFKERARRPAAVGLRKEPSVGQEELNRRVEAFINKFNEEMRLQRQQSFMHYLDMINRGAH